MGQNKKLGNSIWIWAALAKEEKLEELVPKRLELKGERGYPWYSQAELFWNERCSPKILNDYKGSPSQAKVAEVNK